MRTVPLALAACCLLALTASASAHAATTAGWVYTESNDPGPNANAVLAMDYRPSGSLRPLRSRAYPTKGSGELYVPGQSLSVLAADHQVIVSRNRRFLLATNQGTDTIAVFRINRRNGGLSHVPGSPFPSGGDGPTAIGQVGNRVVVANKGLHAGEPPPGNGNLVSFRFSPTGRLSAPVSTIPAPGSPLDAALSPDGRIVFDSEFLAFKLHVLTLGSDANLTDGPAGQFTFDPAVTAGRSSPPGFPPPAVNLPFGIGIHPTKPFVYYTATVAGRIAVYTYDNQGQMRFVRTVENPDVAATCWNVVSPDGRFMYTSNRVTEDVAAWQIAPSGDDLTRIQVAPLPEKGGSSNMAITPDGKSLFVVALHDDSDVPFEKPADGNFVESYSIGNDGRLTARSVAALPVRFSTIPLGLAVVTRSR